MHAMAKESEVTGGRPWSASAVLWTGGALAVLDVLGSLSLIVGVLFHDQLADVAQRSRGEAATRLVIDTVRAVLLVCGVVLALRRRGWWLLLVALVVRVADVVVRSTDTDAGAFRVVATAAAVVAIVLILMPASRGWFAPRRATGG